MRLRPVMICPRNSRCGRFVILDDLHIDRTTFESLSARASQIGLRLQDAMQIAICAFNEDCHAMEDGLIVTPLGAAALSGGRGQPDNSPPPVQREP